MARDEFSQEKRRRLAMRAGHLCSNPGCRQPTAGPQLGDPEGFVDIGVAAHITAAAPGGPRFDEGLTADQRRSLANAIWLCQTCSRLIDVDPNHYTVSLLLAWKVQHEAFAASTLSGRFAALDRRHIEQLATVTRQAVAVLEEVVPIPDPPTSEISLRSFARIRYEHHLDRYELSVTIIVTNLGDQTTLSDPRMTVGPTDTPVVDVHLFQNGLWHLNPGTDAFVVPAMDEIKIRLIIDPETFAGGDYDAGWLARCDVQVGETRHIVEAIAQTNRSLCDAAVGKKLRPLQQWLCDRCHLPILRPEDGWVEVDEDRTGGTVRYHNYRLVHHQQATPRGTQTCYADGLELSDHLHHVIEQGVQWGLSYLGPGEPSGLGAALGEVRDLGEWAVFMRRIWLPFYEQGRHYIERAVQDGEMHRTSVHHADSLELVIDRYVSSEWTPEQPID